MPDSQTGVLKRDPPEYIFRNFYRSPLQHCDLNLLWSGGALLPTRRRDLLASKLISHSEATTTDLQLDRITIIPSRNSPERQNTLHDLDEQDRTRELAA